MGCRVQEDMVTTTANRHVMYLLPNAAKVLGAGGVRARLCANSGHMFSFDDDIMISNACNRDGTIDLCMFLFHIVPELFHQNPSLNYMCGYSPAKPFHK